MSPVPFPAITVIKCDYAGQEVWRYSGRELGRDAGWVQLEAFFNRADVHTAYHTFRQGDRFVEWFFAERWYNIFAMYDVADGHLTGWYCNITRPAQIDGDTVCADDLALDVFVSPQGAITVLDEDEFAALPLDEATRQQALAALAELIACIQTRQPPFDSIPPIQQ